MFIIHSVSEAIRRVPRPAWSTGAMPVAFLSRTIGRSRALQFAVFGLAALAVTAAWAQAPANAPPGSPPSLKTVAVPGPDLQGIVLNQTALIALGKALFWDMQVGSDGIQACASCHFHAGADHRKINQINPGKDLSFAAGTANFTLTAADFPVHKLADINDRGSQVLSDADDRVASMGVFLSEFFDIIPGSAVDRVNPLIDTTWNVGGLTVRRAEPFNTPTVINAAYTQRNFWQARANFYFNGVSPFGQSDPAAQIVVNSLPFGPPQLVTVSIPFSSLASQAMAPPVSASEMSGRDRTWPKIGKKMLSLRPLAKQVVHPSDSVLSSWARLGGRGLLVDYNQLIQLAFDPKYWSSNQIILTNSGGSVASFQPRPARALTTDEYTQAEYNFSFFFGLAVQAYERTLVSDETPFDHFREGDGAALTPQQAEGLELFVKKGKCISCHQEATFTSASLVNIRNENIVERMLINGQPRLYDTGFYNIGVRPTAEDPGVGGKDPFDNPLSFARLLIERGSIPGFTVEDPCKFEVLPCVAPGPNDVPALNGSFKVPSLRNVSLTGPYFHNGGDATLRSVVNHYNRGGNFINSELHPHISPLGLTETEKDALVAFLESLTDNRVRFERAPFDHPQLCVPNGHQLTPDPNSPLRAVEQLVEIKEVGRAGNALPLQTFEELLNDRTSGREHTMTTPCPF